MLKTTFRKAISNGTLNWTELEEVVLDIEININNRPSNYVEDDIELPVLTANSILHINLAYTAEDVHNIPKQEQINLRSLQLRSIKHFSC